MFSRDRKFGDGEKVYTPVIDERFYEMEDLKWKAIDFRQKEIKCQDEIIKIEKEMANLKEKLFFFKQQAQDF